MKHLEISSKTVNKAIQIALAQLGVSREEVEVTVVKEGRHGILGLGAEEARIRVKRLVPKEESGIAEATLCARQVMDDDNNINERRLAKAVLCLIDVLT